MSELLKVSEIVGFAVHIEQNGYAFYTETAKKFNDPKLMDLFHYLAGEEINHERTFKKLQEELGEYKPKESYEGEYESYMQDYLKTIAPKSNVNMKEKVKEIKSMEEAIELALQFEKDSVVFFTTLKRMVAPEKQEPIEAIIQEEISHVLKLHGFKSSSLPPAPDVDAL